MQPTLTKVKKTEEILETLSPKFSKPTDKPPSIMVKFNHDKNVLSLAKNTLGSTLVGKAIFLFGPFCSNGAEEDIGKKTF